MTHQSTIDQLSSAAKNIAVNSPPKFITRLIELAGADVADTLVDEFGGTKVYLPSVSQASKVLLDLCQPSVQGCNQVAQHGHGCRVEPGAVAHSNIPVRHEGGCELNRPVHPLVV